MKTCVSLNCPYIDICRYYDFNVDRQEGCTIRNRITQLAEYEIKNITKT